uniref:Uncharacterized protein n=1 Tax=Chlamydomonas leiostraca TaxID=1034604 RepID=A0A7S0RZU8_9CHLO|mmetsp:Transcript_36077/g.91162  ORF Transcript_36077/g.91162 Transcript_36077/m.91162 type:complete len:316 (+) Transcript_36077:118-1065(+)
MAESRNLTNSSYDSLLIQARLVDAKTEWQDQRMVGPVMLCQGVPYASYLSWQAQHQDEAGVSFVHDAGQHGLGSIVYFIDTSDAHASLGIVLNDLLKSELERLGVQDLFVLRRAPRRKLGAISKEPDLCLFPKACSRPQDMPTLILTVAVSQPAASLKSDLQTWLFPERHPDTDTGQEEEGVQLALGISVENDTAGTRLVLYKGDAARGKGVEPEAVPFSHRDGCIRPGLPRFTLSIPLAALFGREPVPPISVASTLFWSTVHAVYMAARYGDVQAARTVARQLWRGQLCTHVHLDLHKVQQAVEMAMPVPGKQQ